MKTNLLFKIIIGLALLFTRFDSSAQNYTPFPEDSAVWTLQYKPYNTGVWPSQATYLTITGDTIINTMSYNKLYEVGKKYLCGYRNDISNKRVYIIRADSSNEELAFDFNMQIDSTITDFANNPFVVKHVDSVLLNNMTYKAYYNYKANTYNSYFALLEGIGSRSFVASLLKVVLTGGDLVITCFEERNFKQEDIDKMTTGCYKPFNVNGSSFEFKTSLVKVFPNPCKGQLLIEGIETMKKIKVFNVTGQLEVILSSFDKSGNQYQIKLPENLNGLYWLEFDNGHRTKIVIE